MGFLTFVLMGGAVWLLWNISRNTGDALDKQTAIQYELVSLEKKLEALSEKLSSQSPPSAKEEGDVKKTEAPVLKNTEASELVDINHASLKEVTGLPRIGKALAQRIIDSRPYSSVEGLIDVQGISREMLDEIKPLITTS